MGGESVERGHGGGGMCLVLVVRLQPLLKEAVDFGKSQRRIEMLQESGPDRPEQTLYFAASLWRIRSRMDQGDTE